MKKYIKTILVGVTAMLSVCGCTAIKGWLNSADFTTVVSVVSPALKSATTAVVYAVCKKNPDLNKIFIASGNGLKIAINNSDYSTVQIKEYIKQALGENAELWYPLISPSMDAVLSWYSAIYDKYFDIGDSTCLQGFNTLLTSIADGVVGGASVDAKSTLAKSTYVLAKSQEVTEVNNLRVKCAQFGIVIE